MTTGSNMKIQISNFVREAKAEVKAKKNEL